MKLHETEAITFDDLEEIWLCDDSGPLDPIEIVLPDTTEREDKHYAEL